jgi:hypothetical protein
MVKPFLYADGFFFVIEAMVYAVIAADYFHQAKKGKARHERLLRLRM